jgi:DNA-binding winged helix-turn-helix (wHTH) protein
MLLKVSAYWRKVELPTMLYIFGECTLDTQRYVVFRAGVPIPLRRKAFQILAYLLAHADRVVPKQELCEAVWSQQFIGEAALESTIKEVRQAIGDSGRRPQLIQTIYGQGYRFLAAVEAHPEAPAGTASAGCLAPLNPLSALPQASHNLVPSPSPQGTAGAVDDYPETNASGETASLQRSATASAGEWKLVTVLCCALAAPPLGGPPDIEAHYSELQALYRVALRDALGARASLHFQTRPDP